MSFESIQAITLEKNVESVMKWISECKTLDQLCNLELRVEEFVSVERFPKEHKSVVALEYRKLIFQINLKKKEFTNPKSLF